MRARRHGPGLTSACKYMDPGSSLVVWCAGCHQRHAMARPSQTFTAVSVAFILGFLSAVLLCTAWMIRRLYQAGTVEIVEAIIGGVLTVLGLAGGVSVLCCFSVPLYPVWVKLKPELQRALLKVALQTRRPFAARPPSEEPARAGASPRKNRAQTKSRSARQPTRRFAAQPTHKSPALVRSLPRVELPQPLAHSPMSYSQTQSAGSKSPDRSLGGRRLPHAASATSKAPPAAPSALQEDALSTYSAGFEPVRSKRSKRSELTAAGVCCHLSSI